MVCLQENFCIGAYTVRQGTNFIIYSGIVTEILFMIFLGRIFWSFTSQPWISFWYVAFFLHLICLLVDIVTRWTIWCRRTFFYNYWLVLHALLYGCQFVICFGLLVSTKLMRTVDLILNLNFTQQGKLIIFRNPYKLAWPHFCCTQLHSPPNKDFCPRIWAR